MTLRERLVIARKKAKTIRPLTEEDINEQIEHSNHKNNLRERLVIARKKAKTIRPLYAEEKAA